MLRSADSLKSVGGELADMTVKVWMVFEAVGPSEEGVEQSIRDHINTLSEDKGVEVIESDEEDVEHMENPHPSLEEGYSKVAEIRVEFDSFSRALETVINYGPTYVQVEGPDSFQMNLKDAQDSLQTVANTMHEYAQKGAGGVVVSRQTDEQTS
jgi:hypothetical protein